MFVGCCFGFVADPESLVNSFHMCGCCAVCARISGMLWSLLQQQVYALHGNDVSRTLAVSFHYEISPSRTLTF